MKNMRVFRFLKSLGLISRLMIAVGVAIVAGGGVQTILLVAEGAAEHSARLLREQKETLLFLAPLVADQALVGDYAAITQLLKNQVKKGELDRFAWTDKDGKTLIAQDLPDRLDAPTWFARLALIEHEEQNLDVTAGGVGYGRLSVWVTPVKAHNRLWLQFVKQLQIVAVTLFLMLQFIWLIFRGNLGTLRMLAEGANRFSQGDHAVRIEPEGAPEVGLAAEAFNNMANNIEGLIASLGKSESKNKLLATIVEQSSEAIWTKDLAGIITSWNSGAAGMFGYPPADAVGRALNVGESTAQEEEARMQRLMAGEKFSYDARAMTRSGTAIDIQVAVAPLLDQANQWIGSISVARDVTQHKRSEEALRLAREAAESANHAKSSFLARMSNEIRTPMNGVLGMTELLLETGLTSAQRKYAETVQRSGKNLLGIINDLLDFSKIEAGKLELEKVEMDLRRSLEDVVDLLAERAHVKGLELACSIPATLATHVKGDPLRLGQVLTNLVGNAIKFTEQGSVVIRVAGLEETAQSVTLRFEVSDTGAGISAAAQSHIFEELAQAAARNAPFDIAIIDLGLPGMDALELARAIRARADIATLRLVMLTHRQADMQNAREAGIDACLAKPVRQTVLYECLVNVMACQPQEAVAAREVREPVDTAPAGIRGNILLVEDNLINQQVALGILQIQGYSVTVVNNGREALDAHAQGAFDLILMDCHMPEMDGFEATREIRGRERSSIGKRVPIIALTANAMAQDREECLSTGMDDHLSKPFSMQTMQDMLDRWMPQAASTKSAAAAELAARGPAKAAAALDRRVLDQLSTLLKPERLARAINFYLVESPKLIQKLKQAASANDAPEIVRSAHSLKSSSANLGASVLSRYCEDIEASARRADAEEACKLFAKIETEYGCVQTALTAELELAASKA